MRFQELTFATISLLAAVSSPAMALDKTIQPLLDKYCLGCHDTATQKGDLDLQRFSSLTEIKEDPEVWENVLHQIADGEMPPKQKPQFSAEEKQRFTGWVQATLDEIALEQAGDPGPVVLRRLSNREYTYTIRDLTGVASLDPAGEFPVDGAAGEGFTNVGSALVMSPALLTKYLDAAKEVASHAVILPNRIAFSPSTSRADWTQEKLDAIRELHAKFTIAGGETAQDLQGVRFATTDGGVIPIERYLRAIMTGEANNLSAKYLATLKSALQDDRPSVLLDPIRARWRSAKLDDIATIAEQIQSWQRALWHFTKVGHIGKRDGPERWQLPVMPLATEQAFQLKFPDDLQDETILYLIAGDAGDGADGDLIVWRNARLTFPDRPPLPLSQVESFVASVETTQTRELPRTAAYLQLCAKAFAAERSAEELATDHGLNPDLAAAWESFVHLAGETLTPSGHLVGKKTNVGGYAAVRGWGGDLPILLVNQSDNDLDITTLTVPARGVTVHPTPDIDSVVIWQSPVSAKLNIKGFVADADKVCGNGAAWSLELVTAYDSRKLAGEPFNNGGRSEFGPIEDVRVRKGDWVKLTVTAHDRNHTCDTTHINLTIRDSSDGGQVWDLANEIVDRIHEGNPLADSHGNSAVWHFCDSRAGETDKVSIPAESALGQWRIAVIDGENGDAQVAQNSILEPNSDADRAVSALVRNWRGSLAWLTRVTVGDATDIEQTAPSTLEFRLPGSLVAGVEFVANVELHPDKGSGGSAQALATLTKPSGPLPLSPGVVKPAGARPGTSWTAGTAPVVSDRPILVREGSEAQQRMVKDIVAFQQLFPAALCYNKIVPVDEVVTLTLRYREDDQLCRLMLSDAQTAELNRLWDEMRFVSRQPLQQLDAFEQLWQYATQDADPSAFEQMRGPIKQAAAAFEKRLVDVGPVHVQAVLDFATKAWRRPLGSDEQKELWALYQTLRDQQLAHEGAIRQLIARVLVAPAFLYRSEASAPGRDAAPVNDWELATRLSFFLWSTAPDAELRRSAAGGEVHDPEVLVTQTRRMLQDAKIRRLATEFGAQWLHVRDLESLDEKSERHFPTFVHLRSDMQEEAVRFFIDLFQHDRSILSLLSADHTFVNRPLAEHYGIETSSDDWKRVDGLRAMGRGGILGFAGTLAKQSGASRTSPILRGNWISDVLLGEKLPRPPKDVPVLPDEPPGGLTERELIERHSSDPACARCHERIDPLGFALEGFDAIGRGRTGTDTSARLADGTQFDGIDGLRSYLLDTRRDDFVRQFCRKLLGYALGRSVQLSDKPLLDEMAARLAENQYRVHIAIELIVSSPQFGNVRGRL